MATPDSKTPKSAKNPPVPKGESQPKNISVREAYKETTPQASTRLIHSEIFRTVPELRLSELGGTMRGLLRGTEERLRSRDNILRLAGFDPSGRVQQLEADIAKHRADLQKQTLALQTEQKTRKDLQAKLAEFEQTQAKLKEAEQLAFILTRVATEVHEPLFREKEIQNKFFEKEEQDAYVLAIDIRRSTELMLKARKPELFAAFMTALCDRLQDAIKRHFGVFDKFTGDGILAFFPDFFTGSDAAYHAVTVAHEAIGIFQACYKEHRASFTSVLTDVNLATGIDYGPVHLVRVADGLTVVGVPVVYACRLSNGPGGSVLLNQAAFEKLSANYSKFFYIGEENLEIKHEGSILCYNVKPGNSKLSPKDPEWLSAKADQEEEPAAPDDAPESAEKSPEAETPAPNNS